VSPKRFEAITPAICRSSNRVVGDFCLDAYELTLQKLRRRLETGLPVYRCGACPQPARPAGTILNNLVALGVGMLYPVGFAGEDGEATS